MTDISRVHKGRRWTAEEVERVREASAQGMGHRRAALHVGRPATQVAAKAARLGLSLRERDANGKPVHRQGKVLGQPRHGKQGENPEFAEYRRAVLDGAIDDGKAVRAVRDDLDRRCASRVCRECNERPVVSQQARLCFECLVSTMEAAGASDIEWDAERHKLHGRALYYERQARRCREQMAEIDRKRDGRGTVDLQATD